MKFQHYLFYILLLSCITCTKDTDLKRSEFRQDLEFPELPEYSEWGYNTFGAYYDRQAFISNNEQVPVKVISTSNVISFTFKGQLGKYASATNSLSLVIALSGVNITNYSDLILFNGTFVNLASSTCQVTIFINNVAYAAQILNGTIEFKRVQNLFVDKKQEEVILSGVFDFQAIINSQPITFSEGRFDVGIGKDNFFSL